MTIFECELVLRDNGLESRRKHLFHRLVGPGTHVYLDDRDWIVVELCEREGAIAEVVCRPVSEGA
jgi:hypothetical protein